MPDAVQKQIEGICTEISEKNGWTAFAIDVGSQYPIRLSTKLPALIEAGRAAGQQKAVWSFKESQGGENPNKPGTHYVNRYLDGVEVGGTLEPTAATAQTAAAKDWTVKDRQIVRQAMIKAAAAIVAAHGTSDGDFAAETISLAARFETWVRRDVDEPPF